MTTLTLEAEPLAAGVEVSDEWLTAHLTDGRLVAVPLAWYPRLKHGTSEERREWELIGDGEGIHWPDLDEDISVAGLIAGRKSGESERSFRRWLDKRAGQPTPSRPGNASG